MRNLFRNTLGNNKEQKPKEFEALALPLAERLYGAAVTMTKDTLDAEDLLQNTYFKAYRFFHRFEPGTNFSGWMFRILTNDFISEYNKKKAEPTRVNF